MIRLVAALMTLFALGACTVESTRSLGTDGPPLPKAKKIGYFEAKRIPKKVLAAVNTVREGRGLAPLAISPELTAAAMAHSEDMARQQRPWHFGSDGSSPLQRVARAGYKGRFTGELVSETFEHAEETVAAWLEDEFTRAVLLDPEAREMGIGWYQEPNRKIWWTLVLGNPDLPPLVPAPVPPPPAEDTRDGQPVPSS